MQLVFRMVQVFYNKALFLQTRSCWKFSLMLLVGMVVLQTCLTRFVYCTNTIALNLIKHLQLQDGTDSPLLAACRLGDSEGLDAVELLLQHGANPDGHDDVRLNIATKFESYA